MVMGNKKFKIVFADKNNQSVDIDYTLNDTSLAEKWFPKIKHLKNIPIDPIESKQVNLSNLKEIYEQFCKFADIPPIKFETVDQKLCNQLHEIYEKSHGQLSKSKDSSILYKFHHSIHFHEGICKNTNIKVGWGVKEGPLTEKFHCNSYYEDKIIANNMYLPWAELGKTPKAYWEDKEPNDQDRFNALAKPHKTFRAKLFIATEDKNPKPFDVNFVEWFNKYKDNWFAHHNIQKWDNIDEDSAPLLATTDYKHSIKGFKFSKIIL